MNDGELLKKARKKLGWTQGDVADYFNVERPLIAHWESERRNIPDVALKKAREIRRGKKEDVQERFNKVRLYHLSQKEKKSSCTSNRGKNVHSEKVCGTKGSTPSLTHSPLEICSQNPPSVTLSDSLQPEAEKDDFLPPKEDSIEYFILECYVDFKKKTKRYPIDRDFMSGTTGDLHKQEVLKHFGCLSKAKLEAEKFRKLKRAEHLKQSLIQDFPMIIKVSEDSTTSETGSFSCPCCGKLWRRSNRYYPVLDKVIKDKLESLSESKGYKEAVHGLLGFLFGDTENQNCFCGGRFRSDWKSSFKILVSGRLESLLPLSNGKTPMEAVWDCQMKIFGEQGNRP